jgi:hypothetical protein
LADSLEELGISKLEFQDFLEKAMRLIPDLDSPAVKAKLLSIEISRQIGKNGMPVKCIKSNCQLWVTYLIKYRNDSVPAPLCSWHLKQLVQEIESRSWEHFGNDPIVVENYTIIPPDTWPGLIRARIRQLKNLAP